MEWTKLGLLFEPPRTSGWLFSHASVPVAHSLGGDRWRVYFSSRDEQQRSYTGFFEFDLSRLDAGVELCPEPVLRPGRRGGFDDAGAMACWLIPDGDDLHLYYVGWNRGVSVPFRNALGRAVSRDGGQSFQRDLAGPLLDRSIHDPAFTASACILRQGDRWRAWYLSCLAWEPVDGALRHRYHVKYAESDDGIEWHRDGRVAIDFSDAGEYAISRPCVIQDRELFRMWYSYRGANYRIGYAESPDGLTWTRRDAVVGIDVSPGSWDSEMIEYPFVFDHRGRRYMLYNGNGYGETGIGLATLAA